MREGAAFAIVAMLGDRLVKERTGWRDAKALIVLVAETGDWSGACCLADALGVGPDRQETIYREVYGMAPPHAIRTPANLDAVPESDRTPATTERRTA